jgi:hypothetical protein
MKYGERDRKQTRETKLVIQFFQRKREKMSRFQRKREKTG